MQLKYEGNMKLYTHSHMKKSSRNLCYIMSDAMYNKYENKYALVSRSSRKKNREHTYFQIPNLNLQKI